MEALTTIEEREAAIAFDKQAAQFDILYNNNITAYKRKRVREHVERFLPERSSILELNAGTGEDAVYFAGKGHSVHATDISAAMQHELIGKVKANQLENSVSVECCSFTNLEMLQRRGPYGLIFSNFAGLNCTSQLDKVLRNFSDLLKPGGYISLVLLPPFCLWEFLLLFKGKFRTAFRRFSGRKGAKARIEGEEFRCWYYKPSFIRKHLKDEFDLVGLEGLCTLLPPSYIEDFSEKHPRLNHFLEKKEKKLKSKWPWRVIGDYYIISFRKKEHG